MLSGIPLLTLCVRGNVLQVSGAVRPGTDSVEKRKVGVRLIIYAPLYILAYILGDNPSLNSSLEYRNQ